MSLVKTNDIIEDDIVSTDNDDSFDQIIHPHIPIIHNIESQQTKTAKLTWSSVSTDLNIIDYQMSSKCNITHLSITTPFDIQQWFDLLSQHPDQVYVNSLINGLKYGVNICYTGDRSVTFTASNSSDSKIYSKFVTEQLIDDCRLNRRAGPFKSSPFTSFKSSPLNVISKSRNDSSLPDKLRLVHNLSWPFISKNQIRSVNIDTVDLLCNLSSLDSAVELINKLTNDGESKCWLYKLDVKSAYRCIPVRQQDWSLLGCKWNDHYYFDKSLPFGLKSSCSIWESYATAAQWIINHHLNINNIIHYVDDYLGFESNLLKAQSSIQSVLEMFNQLGIPIAPDKIEHPTTVIEFLGIIIDTEKRELRLPRPESKLIKLRIMMNEWNLKSKATLKELQSVVGFLSWCSNVVKPGRTFLTRLIQSTSVSINSSLPRNLSNQIKLDLKWWRNYSHHHNGITSISDSKWLSQSDIQLFSDACGTGWGAILNNQYYCYDQWSENDIINYSGDSSLKISSLELLELGNALSSFGYANLLKSKKIELYTDNTAAMTAIKSGTCKNQSLMNIARSMWQISALYDFEFRIQHIKGTDNILADLLSRNLISEFYQACPTAMSTPVPTRLLLMHEW